MLQTDYILMDGQTEIASWPSIPGRINLPDGDIVFGATQDWRDGPYSITTIEWDHPDENFYVVTGRTSEPKPIADIKQYLKDQVAADRYVHEQSVAGVAWNGHMAQVDRESRANYVGMVVAVQANLRTDNSIYKFVDGHFPVKNSDIVELAMAVANYVQDLYTKEAAIVAQIDALTTVAAAQSFTWSWI